jgi:hypothetical protein
METNLLDTTTARRRLAATLGVLAAAVALPVVGTSLVQADSIAPVTTGGTGSTGTTGTTADPNNYSCTGSIAKGSPEAGTPGTQVKYQFSCNGPITGYEIETEPHQIQYFDASPTASINGVPSTDNFECQGISPGVELNCVGQSTAAGELITGQFTITGKLSTEPRLDPILIVTEATATATAVSVPASTKSQSVTSPVTVTQSISGPFDLGRPVGEPHDAFSGDTRLGNHPPLAVLTSRNKKHVYTTSPVPLDGTTGTTGVKR